MSSSRDRLHDTIYSDRCQNGQRDLEIESDCLIGAIRLFSRWLKSSSSIVYSALASARAVSCGHTAFVSLHDCAAELVCQNYGNGAVVVVAYRVSAEKEVILPGLLD